MATPATLCLGTHRAKPFKKFKLVLARSAADADSSPDAEDEARPGYVADRENDLECTDDGLEE